MKIFKKLLSVLVPFKLFYAKVEQVFKKTFKKVLGLVKYESQAIPMPKVTDKHLVNSLQEEVLKHKKSLQNQYGIQGYYLFQLTCGVKSDKKNRTKQAAKKDVVKFISILHFLSYKDSFKNSMGSASVNLYKPIVKSADLSVKR